MTFRVSSWIDLIRPQKKNDPRNNTKLHEQITNGKWFANEMDEAHRHVQKMLEIEPNFDAAHWQLGSIVSAYGRYEDAIAAYQKSLSLGGNFVALSTSGLCYGLLGKRDEALAVLS